MEAAGMKKRIAAGIMVLCLALAFVPTVSHAAITPYFIAVNDTLLPFNDDHMPFVIGGDFFVPVRVFEDLDIFAVGSDELERVLLYRGASRYLIFSARPGDGRTTDQDGNTLQWPSARRIGRRFYVPLQQVCDFFGLTFSVIPISRDIIQAEQMHVVRIMSNFEINERSFVGIYRHALRAAYAEYYAPPPPPGVVSPPPSGVAEPPEIEEPPPDFSDVTIYLSFYDVSAGSVEWILDMLDFQTASGHQACFFVSADDIKDDPGLIRRIAGSGHTVGIRLSEGTYDEYLATQALLFEAAKIRTVLVSVDDEARSFHAEMDLGRLLIWGSSMDQGSYDTLTVSAITELIPTESGARGNLLFSCSENSAAVLPGVISYLLANEYTIDRITETVEPVDAV
jgi:hypothetical protein